MERTILMIGNICVSAELWKYILSCILPDEKVSMNIPLYTGDFLLTLELLSPQTCGSASWGPLKPVHVRRECEWTRTKYLNIFSQLHSFCLKHTCSLAGQLAVASDKGERQLGRLSSSASITGSVKGLLSLAFLHSRHTLHMTNLFFKRKPQNAYPKNSAAAAFLLRRRLSYGLVLVWEVRNLTVFAVIGLTWNGMASQELYKEWEKCCSEMRPSAVTYTPEPAWVLSIGIMRNRHHLKKTQNKKQWGNAVSTGVCQM